MLRDGMRTLTETVISGASFRSPFRTVQLWGSESQQYELQADREQAGTPEVPLEQLHKVQLPVPRLLRREARNHPGSDQAAWTAWCPAFLTDEHGRTWQTLGVGGSRVALESPAELGVGYNAQVLKVGTQPPPASLQPQYRGLNDYGYYFHPHRAFQTVHPPHPLAAIFETRDLYCLYCRGFGACPSILFPVFRFARS